MTKNKLKGLISLGSVITAIGFILLFFSVLILDYHLLNIG